MTHRVPILVTGTHRSGTTWVGRMLALRSDVIYIHEPFNVEYCRERYHLPLRYWYSYLPDVADQTGFHLAYRRLLQFENYPEHAPNYSWHYRLRRRIRQRAENVYHKLTGPRVLIKDPLALLSAGQLAETYGFQVICLIRHPLAFSSSLKKWKWSFPFRHLLAQPQLMREVLPDFQDEITRLARDDENVDLVTQGIVLWNALHHVIRRYQSEHPEWIFVRHEDLVRHAVERFGDIYSRLNLEFTPACRAAIQASGAAKGGETKHTAFKARDHQSVLDTWRGRLTSEEVEAILDGTRELRAHFYADHEATVSHSATPVA